MTNEQALGPWNVQGLRITLFPGTEWDMSTFPSHKAVFGVEPEEEVRRPHLGQIRSSGRLGGLDVSLEWSPQRIDLTLEQQIEADAPTDRTSRGEQLALFLKSAKQLLGVGIATNRIAFGARLVQDVASRSAGYVLLQAKLPNVTLDAENSSDFQYQINRRRRSGLAELPDLEINRLSKWGVVSVATTVIAFGAGASIAPQSPKGYFAVLELDINTAPQIDTFSPNTLESIFNKLVELGLEIAERGDVP